MSQTRHLAAFSRRLFNVSSRLRDNRAPRRHAGWPARECLPGGPNPLRRGGPALSVGNGPLPAVGWRRRVSRDFSQTFLRGRRGGRPRRVVRRVSVQLVESSQCRRAKPAQRRHADSGASPRVVLALGFGRSRQQTAGDRGVRSMGSPAIPTGTQSHVETTMEICVKS